MRKPYSTSRKIEIRKKFVWKDIDLVVYDFDGVMTDNKVFVFQDEKEAVVCNRADGLAVSILKKKGIRQLILSTETNSVVVARAKKLNIPILSGIDDKVIALKKYCAEHRIQLKRTMFVGNDINDIKVMKIVGCSIAPADASREVKNIANFTTKKFGGEGVIREILDIVA